MKVAKGAQTHDRILLRALRFASRDGLAGLTIGTLATELKLSKSGLFAHFGSKEELQLQVLQTAVARFTEVVVRPALSAPRGLPRLRALFRNWLQWGAGPGGCILITAAVELDDRPGPQREFLVSAQRQWSATLATAVRLAITTGHLRRSADPEQLAFELYAIMLGYHHARRLLRDAQANRRARVAFERLLASATA